jgi:DNA-binding YbaB/EbfC family protein
MMGNMGGMMKKVQEMQAKMQEMQKELENKTVEAESGGGMVKVTMNGKQVVQSINIDPSLLSEDEKEVLEDLIKAALNQAKEKVEEMSCRRNEKINWRFAIASWNEDAFLIWLKTNYKNL